MKEVNSVEVWNYLLSMADALDKDIQQKCVSRKNILQKLDSLSLMFESMNDPLENFQEYAFLHFCRKMQESIEELP